MNTFGLNVIASDKQFYRGRGKSISLPAKDGEITIWAHHADMMIAIVPGEIRFQDEDDRWHTAVAGGGFAQVINNRVMVLADSIEKPEEVAIEPVDNNDFRLPGAKGKEFTRTTKVEGTRGYGNKAVGFCVAIEEE